MNGLGSLMEAMTGGIRTTTLLLNDHLLDKIKDGDAEIGNIFLEADIIFTHLSGILKQQLEFNYPSASQKIRVVPKILFAGFHPDMVYIKDRAGKKIVGPMGEYQSSIVFFAWRHGIPAHKVKDLFCEEVYSILRFDRYWQLAEEDFLEEGQRAGWQVEGFLEKWKQRGCWMYSMNHPKLFALADIARAALERELIKTLPHVEEFVADTLSYSAIWPVYPELADKLGLKGSYLFKRPNNSINPYSGVQMIDLETLVEESFALYARFASEDLSCDRIDLPEFAALDKLLRSNALTAQPVKPGAANTAKGVAAVQLQSNPYTDLPPYRFWRRSIERVKPAEVDPVVKVRFKLRREDKIATAGSCFAQHISGALANNGFNYLVTETPAGLTDEDALNQGYGVFSARYGNIYTSRQLVQLFDRAYGKFSPIDNHWVRSDGKLVDPFRPQISPDGFSSIDELEASRTTHFAAVRAMFESLDVFVFTLGLTEGWRSRHDGAVFPLAPGVVAGSYSGGDYEFVNFSVRDVVADAEKFLARLRGVNPSARVIFTVSPVPLIATYEDRHVLVSTTLSKAVLRAAADEIVASNAHCEYFPSFEIITGSYTKGAYFENDLRSVKPKGVSHVLRLFLQHFAGGAGSGPEVDRLRADLRATRDIVCDEEAIARSVETGQL